MEGCALVSTPMVTCCKLTKHDEYIEANEILYSSMISILLYVKTSRIDIIQAVGLVA